MRSPYVDGDDIAVSVEDGVATLSGVVRSWTAHRDATRQALEGGAVRVRDELDVAGDHLSSHDAEGGHE